MMALSSGCKYTRTLVLLLGAMALGLLITTQFSQRVTIPAGVVVHRKDARLIASGLVSDGSDATMNSATNTAAASISVASSSSPKFGKHMAPHSDLSKKLRILAAQRAAQASREALPFTSNKTDAIRRRTDLVAVEKALSRAAPDLDPNDPMLPPAQLPNVSKCNDKYCLEYLSQRERHAFEECTQRTAAAKDRLGNIQSDDTCHFQNGTNRHPVALASFPGSGNTWMRGILQKITGICTGAIYCDRELRAHGFTGESILGPSVIAIKTHNNKGRFTNGHLPPRVYVDVPIYGAAILLVRDPKSALVAEWHRQKTRGLSNATFSSHYLTAGEEYFNDNEDWDKFVRVRAKRWRDHVTGWIMAAKYNPLHIVRYEDLKKDTVKEMKKVMDFLGFSDISDSDIKERLGEGYNTFYRNHKDIFSHYTQEQKEFVHQRVEETIEIVKDQGKENLFPIDLYL